MDFKKLSDVEVVAEPSNAANVLIEENGVIKKAPKTAVGGGSGDIVVFAVDHYMEMDYDSTIINGRRYINGATCNKTFEEVVELYCNNNLNIMVIKENMGGLGLCTFYPVNIWLADEYGEPVSIDNAGNAVCVVFMYFTMNDNMTMFYYDDGLALSPPQGEPM